MPLPLVVGLVAPLIAKAIPSLVGYLFGDKGEKIANKVVDTAKKITGIDDPEKAIAAIEKDPKFLPLLIKELDVEIEEIRGFTQVQEALNKADESGKSTRPAIANIMAYLVAFVVITFSSIWAYAIGANKVEMIKALQESWPLMLTVLGTPTALLRAYFGMRTKEKKARYELAAGAKQDPGVLGTIAGLFKKP